MGSPPCIARIIRMCATQVCDMTDTICMFAVTYACVPISFMYASLVYVCHDALLIHVWGGYGY